MVSVQRHQSSRGYALMKKQPPNQKKKKKAANNDTFSSSLHSRTLTVEEFCCFLTGLEHSEMMDLVPLKNAYNRSVRCPI